MVGVVRASASCFGVMLSWPLSALAAVVSPAMRLTAGAGTRRSDRLPRRARSRARAGAPNADLPVDSARTAATARVRWRAVASQAEPARDAAAQALRPGGAVGGDGPGGRRLRADANLISDAGRDADPST